MWKFFLQKVVGYIKKLFRIVVCYIFMCVIYIHSVRMGLAFLSKPQIEYILWVLNAFSIICYNKTRYNTDFSMKNKITFCDEEEEESRGLRKGMKTFRTYLCKKFQRTSSRSCVDWATKWSYSNAQSNICAWKIVLNKISFVWNPYDQLCKLRVNHNFFVGPVFNFIFNFFPWIKFKAWSD